jgi:hypothetical protein
VLPASLSSPNSSEDEERGKKKRLLLWHRFNNRHSCFQPDSARLWALHKQRASFELIAGVVLGIPLPSDDRKEEGEMVLQALVQRINGDASFRAWVKNAPGVIARHVAAYVANPRMEQQALKTAFLRELADASTSSTVEVWQTAPGGGGYHGYWLSRR